MNPRITPIKRKIVAAIFIDTLLLIILLLVGYAFFVPARAEHVEWPTDTPSPTMLPSPTDTAEQCPTNTTEPSATSTLEPSPTSTLEPSPTSTLEPSPTSTLEPSPTNTTEPSATFTLEPSPTSTTEPSATFTLEPSPTSTTEPSATFTLEPIPTSTTEPSSTSTFVPPSPTNAPEPSATFKPSASPTQKPTRTIIPSQTSTQTGPIEPRQTPTSVMELCSDCYLIKDFRESIISGLYTADLLNTQDISSTLRVAITLYNGYMISEVGSTIHMVDNQPVDEVMRVETPLWCIKPVPGADYWIHTVATAQTTEGTLWLVLDEWVRVNPLTLRMSR